MPFVVVFGIVAGYGVPSDVLGPNFNNTNWELWRKANLRWIDERGTLTAPLGNWMRGISLHRQLHFAYTDMQIRWPFHSSIVAFKIHRLGRSNIAHTRGEQNQRNLLRGGLPAHDNNADGSNKILSDHGKP